MNKQKLIDKLYSIKDILNEAQDTDEIGIASAPLVNVAQEELSNLIKSIEQEPKSNAFDLGYMQGRRDGAEKGDY